MKSCANEDCPNINPQSYDNFYSRVRNGKKRVSTYYSYMCRSCHNKFNIPSHYAKYRELRRSLVRDGKNKPCVDCGKKYPYYVMDYDHVRGEKLFTITSKWMSRSLVSLLAEIAKCDVVCSNCHRQRTYDRLKSDRGGDANGELQAS